MTFTDWLTKLPEQKAIEVNSNPLILEIAREAYNAGKFEQAERHRQDRIKETMNKAATRS